MENQAYKLFMLLKDITGCCQDREIQQAKRFGLTVPEARCMVSIKEKPSRTIDYLMAELSLTRSKIIRIIDGLVKKGVVEKYQKDEEPDSWKIMLTNKGNETASKFIAFTLSLHEEVIHSIPKDIKDQLIPMLHTIKEAMTTVQKQF